MNLWHGCHFLNLIRGDEMNKILGVVLIVLSIVMMMWGLGTGNEFDEYK